VTARCEVLTTERKRSEFKARDVELDMARLVKGSAEQHRGLADTENAAAALAAVLAYTVSHEIEGTVDALRFVPAVLDDSDSGLAGVLAYTESF
jgi:hypothetical protein